MDSDKPFLVYESGYRRVAFAIVSLVAIVVAWFAALVWAYRSVADGNALLSLMLWSVAAVVVLVAAVVPMTYRVHRWTLESDGVRIEERPRLPFVGLRRQVRVAYADVLALRNVESGVDFLIELATRDGRCFRLMQPPPLAATARRPMNEVDLEAFRDALLAAVASRNGGAAPRISEGLAFWNTVPGLCLVAVLLLASLALAGMAAWAMWGGGLQPTARSGQTTAIAILLPLGVAWWLRKSWLRRRRVLAR